MKVAAAVPEVRVADCRFNAGQIAALACEAAARGVEAVVFPELSVTGYTCGDLFGQSLLAAAAEEAAAEILDRTSHLPLTLIFGAPVAVADKLYNCAIVAAGGKVTGIVPKINIPNYAEFYEQRWFASGAGMQKCTINYCGQEADFGSDLLFETGGVLCGVEICEDLWVTIPPSSVMALNGARVIFNLSASPETAGKYECRRNMLLQHSARTLSAYVYASAGNGESSTDLVFSGCMAISECGRMIAEGERFKNGSRIVAADVDIELIGSERRRRNTFAANEYEKEYTVESIVFDDADNADETVRLDRTVEPHPFVPGDKACRDKYCDETFEIQTLGLVQRLKHTHCTQAVIGVSGGLDSTLALLVTAHAFDLLGLDRKGITGITMPGFGTTDRTCGNAVTIMREMGISMREVPIADACRQHFKDIGLDASSRSTAYENAQARERTQILMDTANMLGGIVIGTGDMSEAALGWATYNGDHMSMYNVNCSVPKTLVREIVVRAAETERNGVLAAALNDIADTPVSPELLPAENGSITQKTEDIIGPYELHDFFLYNMLRHGFTPAKTEFLAQQAFGERYSAQTIRHWSRIFTARFFSQQYKRSAVPDGPKTGSLSLSPRGDWRMPSDASPDEWLGGEE